MMEPTERQKQLSKGIGTCWSEEAFRQKLLTDPHGAWKSAGIDVPPGRKVKTVENSNKVFHLVIPPAPTGLSDDDLKMLAGGSGPSWGPFFAEASL